MLAGLYRLELEERKQLSRERLWAPGQPMPVDRTRRGKTSEDRNAIGEYGAETMMSPDGRVLFGKVLPVLNHASVKVRGIRSYTQKAEIGGKTIERQKAAGTGGEPVICR